MVYQYSPLLPTGIDCAQGSYLEESRRKTVKDLRLKEKSSK
jgi:hypothetical protein